MFEIDIIPPAKTAVELRPLGVVPAGKSLAQPRRPRLDSIQTRLPLLMTALLATAIAAAMGFAYDQVRSAAVFAAQDRLARVTDQMTELLRVGGVAVKTALAPQTHNSGLREFLLTPSTETRSRALAALDTVLGKSVQIVDVELWDSSGEDKLSVGPLGSAVPPIIRRELLTPPAKGDSAVLGSLHLVGGIPVFAAAAPIVDGGRTIGYLVERGRLSASPTAAHALGDLIGNAAGVFVGNVRGDVFSDFWLAVDGPTTIPDKPGEVFQYERRGAGGGPRYALEKVIPATPWLMLVELPRDKVLAPVTLFLRNATLFALFLLLVGATGLWIVSRNITRPLSDLRQAAIAFTDGDYSRRLDLSRHDELGELSRAFDTMANRVAGAQSTLTGRLASMEGQYWVVVDGITARTRALEKAYIDLERNRHELKVVNEDLEAFTYSVSHDLRAPIRQIEGFSRILEEHLDATDPQAEKCLRRIQHGSQQMGRLVDDLLSFAQLGRNVDKSQSVSLSSLVGEVLVNVRSEAPDRTIDWKINELPPMVCDAGLMKVVFTNLLSNAVKYTRPREKAVIEVGHEMRDGETVLFVRDNGVGFDMKYADKLFGVFQRLHRADEFEGTGVGLATVHRIVRKHEGSIWAEAYPDGGATFFFTLGLKAIAQEVANA